LPANIFFAAMPIKAQSWHILCKKKGSIIIQCATLGMLIPIALWFKS
jgi:hypothetical protein